MAKIAEVREVSPTKLKFYERNAKIHGKDQIEKLKKSIEEFGFLSPCLIDREYNLIAGHGRVMAALELGMETVPCVFIEGLTDAQRRAYILADNRLGELAEWDRELVNSELDELAQEGFAVELTGFDWDAAAKIEPIEDEYAHEAADSLPERTKRGMIYQLGEHRLMCGDSTDPDDARALMDGALADMVFTDPPYGVAIGSKNKMLADHGRGGVIKEDIENDTASPEELYEILVRAFSVLRENAADSCSYYVTSPQGGELGLMMMMMMRDAGLPVRHTLIWVKSSACFSMGRLDYDYRHEPIFYTWTKTHKFRGGYDNSVIDEYGRLENLEKSELKELVHALRGDGKTTTIYCDKPTRSDLHPTMKPVRLVSRFIYNSSEEGDIVADIFGGSGTTLIACEQLKRKCRMMELDPHYCDVIIDRWEQFTGKKAVLLNG
jgi:DNA modification methylase